MKNERLEVKYESEKYDLLRMRRMHIANVVRF